MIGEGACTFFRTGSFANGVRLVAAIGQIEGLDAHHPDVDIRHDGVTVRLITITDDYYGLSDRDAALARQISELAAQLGVAADPSYVQSFNITIDAHVIADVLPFWRALLGYEDRGDNPGEDLIDPRTREATVWFQPMDVPRTERNRLHIDVWVPHDHAETRIAAAVAAGGHVVSDEHAPAWWVLADVEGNEACVSTVLTRE